MKPETSKLLHFTSNHFALRLLHQQRALPRAAIQGLKTSRPLPVDILNSKALKP